MAKVQQRNDNVMWDWINTHSLHSSKAIRSETPGGRGQVVNGMNNAMMQNRAMFGKAISQIECPFVVPVNEGMAQVGSFLDP